MFQEVVLRCDTKARDRQGKGNMPVPRFAHHLSRLGIDEFDRSGPFRMIGLSLCGL